MKQTKPDIRTVWNRYQRGVQFNQQIGLYQTVEDNENMYIGKQWEGVQANGLPTPVFNLLKRVTMFQVATITSDNIAVRASALQATRGYAKKDVEKVAEIINEQLASAFERNRIPTMLREYGRNAAVDGDACMYTYFDPTVENGQDVKGELITEIIENTRVHFGNPNSRDVQSQPWILLARRMLLEDAQWRARNNGIPEDQIDLIRPDEQGYYSKMDSITDGRVTVLLYFWRDRETGTIWRYESTQNACICEPIDTGTKLYPITWLCWDYIHDSYHGQASITQLRPNQIFINRMFAMVFLSLMTLAFPKIIYDKTRLPGGWDSRVGAAIAVNGGDVNNIAKIMDPAQISPQVGQFIQLAVDYTQSFLGASDVAMGDSRPDNTSAILALQRAANTPLELTKQNLYQSVEDLCKIYIDQMRVFFGVRVVESKPLDVADNKPLGIDFSQAEFLQEFDFATLGDIPVSVKLDVGASSYWSEIASMQTLDNLLMQNKIGLREYLERVPAGFISKKQELIDLLDAAAASPVGGGGAPVSGDGNKVDELPIQGGGGYGALQRAVTQEGVNR